MAGVVLVCLLQAKCRERRRLTRGKKQPPPVLFPPAKTLLIAWDLLEPWEEEKER